MYIACSAKINNFSCSLAHSGYAAIPTATFTGPTSSMKQQDNVYVIYSAMYFASATSVFGKIIAISSPPYLPAMSVFLKLCLTFSATNLITSSPFL